MKRFIVSLVPLLQIFAIAEALKCYECGLRDNDDYCPDSKLRWDQDICESAARLSSGEVLACFKTSFEDQREALERGRRGCAVINEKLAGNCTGEAVTYDGSQMNGITCYCNDESLCNSAKKLSNSKLGIDFQFPAVCSTFWHF